MMLQVRTIHTGEQNASEDVFQDRDGGLGEYMVEMSLLDPSAGTGSDGLTVPNAQWNDPPHAHSRVRTRTRAGLGGYRARRPVSGSRRRQPGQNMLQIPKEYSRLAIHLLPSTSPRDYPLGVTRESCECPCQVSGRGCVHRG
ncbi:hypothetical protein BOTBODRAFT_569466 [Botryobasidium botryosum FD-172 SS1]|uniref:Uncharacterized protein n=1 Tax=Botryobasidium botryosum (strain FD-172 SS1) TaxID=930990 RepID=A0A067M9U9_BOTB1|nr:hypothetical protein BOTBODRAFT_569466 [Botryobasidium botryosum FD-172 SS1]